VIFGILLPLAVLDISAYGGMLGVARLSFVTVMVLIGSTSFQGIALVGLWTVGVVIMAWQLNVLL
jgi:hypothetical protein